MMAANPQCPLDPFVMDNVEIEMNLARVLEIENHITSSSCVHPPLKNIVLHGAVDGSTPLLIACEEGDLPAVQRIVDVWGADVRRTADYYHYDGEKIQEATPLFVAAINGHIDVVEYLISKNADVSAVTSTEGHPRYRGLTPLHGALLESDPDQSFSEKCAEGNAIVRLLLHAGADPSTRAKDGIPAWYRPYCGADATIALVNHGLNVNEKFVLSYTMLHHWILFPSSVYSTCGITEEERLRVLQLLLDHGADLMAQDDDGFTPIVLSAQLKLYDIMELLLEKEEIDRREKITALELAGARLLLSFKSQKAHVYWRKALHLRNEEGHDPIIKIPLHTTSEHAVEWITSAELNKVIEDDSVHWIQAMVTRLRIYAARSWNAVEHFIGSEFSPFFFLDGDDYFGVKEDPTLAHQLDLVLEFLGVFVSFEPHITEKPELWMLTEKLTKELLYTLPYLPFYENYELQCERIKTSLRLILKADPDGRFTLQPGYKFFAMLASAPDVLLPQDVRKYFAKSARQNVGFLLASACEKEDWTTLRLLLHLGADPKATGNGGHGLLHIIAGREEDPIRTNAANLLFVYGAQPYGINSGGNTAVDIWMQKNCGGEGMQSPAWDLRPYWCRDTVPKLSSLAAKTINIHGISFTCPDDLPVELLPFIENH